MPTKVTIPIEARVAEYIKDDVDLLLLKHVPLHDLILCCNGSGAQVNKQLKIEEKLLVIISFNYRYSSLLHSRFHSAQPLFHGATNTIADVNIRIAEPPRT